MNKILLTITVCLSVFVSNAFAVVQEVQGESQTCNFPIEVHVYENESLAFANQVAGMIKPFSQSIVVPKDLMARQRLIKRDNRVEMDRSSMIMYPVANGQKRKYSMDSKSAIYTVDGDFVRGPYIVSKPSIFYNPNKTNENCLSVAKNTLKQLGYSEADISIVKLYADDVSLDIKFPLRIYQDL